jgi:TctA family transporter
MSLLFALPQQASLVYVLLALLWIANLFLFILNKLILLVYNVAVAKKKLAAFVLCI